MQHTTLQYRIRTSRAGRRRLEQVLLDMGELYNALLHYRKAATENHKGQFSLSAQTKAVTQLRREEPRYAQYAYRLLDRVAMQANGAWNAAAKTNTRPRTKSPYRYDILEISEPRNVHLQPRADAKQASIHIKGLPTLKFKPDHRLPQGEQPRLITVLRRPRGFVVNLNQSQSGMCICLGLAMVL